MGLFGLFGKSLFTLVVFCGALIYNPPPYWFPPSIFLDDPLFAPVLIEQDLVIPMNKTIQSLVGGTFFR